MFVLSGNNHFKPVFRQFRSRNQSRMSGDELVNVVIVSGVISEE